MFRRESDSNPRFNDLIAPRPQSTYLGGFMEDERLRRRVAEGVLRFVLWDSTPECVNHLKCYQPLQYGHAILAHWGRHVHLSMADHDEYFAIPYPTNITTIQVLPSLPSLLFVLPRHFSSHRP